jgi:hypothetical protein
MSTKTLPRSPSRHTWTSEQRAFGAAAAASSGVCLSATIDGHDDGYDDEAMYCTDRRKNKVVHHTFSLRESSVRRAAVSDPAGVETLGCAGLPVEWVREPYGDTRPARAALPR